jgi:DNA-directed RNA polymerase subunit RPC12/RpoP
MAIEISKSSLIGSGLECPYCNSEKLFKIRKYEVSNSIFIGEERTLVDDYCECEKCFKRINEQFLFRPTKTVEQKSMVCKK